MKKILLGIGAFVIATSALASTGTGKITGLVPYTVSGTEVLFIKIENTSSDTPACNWSQRYAIKSTSPHFKYTQSVALAAFMSGTPVLIRGANNCDVYDNAETFSYLCIGTTPC